VLGKGGFGKVWKVKRRKNKSYFALKVMSKAKYFAFYLGLFKRKVFHLS
jgi:serine/threonine protein kinase